MLQASVSKGNIEHVEKMFNKRTEQILFWIEIAIVSSQHGNKMPGFFCRGVRLRNAFPVLFFAQYGQ